MEQPARRSVPPWRSSSTEPGSHRQVPLRVEALDAHVARSTATASCAASACANELRGERRSQPSSRGERPPRGCSAGSHADRAAATPAARSATTVPQQNPDPALKNVRAGPSRPSYRRVRFADEPLSRGAKGSRPFPLRLRLCDEISVVPGIGRGRGLGDIRALGLSARRRHLHADRQTTKVGGYDGGAFCGWVRLGSSPWRGCVRRARAAGAPLRGTLLAVFEDGRSATDGPPLALLADESCGTGPPPAARCGWLFTGG